MLTRTCKMEKKKNIEERKNGKENKKTGASSSARNDANALKYCTILARLISRSQCEK